MELPPGAGLPPLCALGAVSVCAVPLAVALARSKPLEQGRVLGISVVTGCCAAIFWIWALLNCQQHFDLGVVTFAIALVASAVGMSASAGDGSASRARLFRCLGPVACLLVAVNFLLGLIIIAKPWTLRLYFILSFGWWLLAGALSLEFAVPLAKRLAGGGAWERSALIAAPLDSKVDVLECVTGVFLPTD
eukprot:CAMPEP_0203946216 /NCGR_PEP_ID=MMETSP0359-20131031/81536_1 /ASSEMBLY_ACC=CAM_ASM_000338 /TAXON_ID=268821 /ORGANISM="Scrippsiella Hangoei, Strain SHTV-5" /LENGTH=190 /DNA_ID=CAMNT_0050877485 /DNA_START=98 /DNA_END=666 /DNA_ORIENTATION=+